ncbi:hypothetical protein F2P81_011318 [Scophthalmus maximus]|uniref:Uncharacterized protein n=1 Tax=Scophthalmus maximus TaxID=52904 RepID=A0A6A4SLB6_SCOMX|nr:hypothetical protein F2P81_011318 [Scophthalmus maximus]
MLFFLQPSQPISATPANIGALSQVEAPIGLIGGLGESTFVAVGVGGLVSRSRSKRTSAVNTLSLIRPPRLNNMISMGNKTVKRVQVYWMLWREDLHRLYESHATFRFCRNVAKPPRRSVSLELIHCQKLSANQFSATDVA